MTWNNDNVLHLANRFNVEDDQSRATLAHAVIMAEQIDKLCFCINNLNKTLSKMVEEAGDPIEHTLEKPDASETT